MPRDMFGDVVDPSIKLGSQAWYTVPLSILAHVVLFAAVIIIPLMAADVLPTPADDDGVRRRPAAAATATAAAAAGGRAAARRRRRRSPIPTRRRSKRPKEIMPRRPLRRPVSARACPAASKVASRAASSVVSSAGCPKRPPPPPPPPSAPVRVGGNIKAPTKTQDVKPVYPPIAQSARVQGVVIIEATIGADGRVKDAKVLRSIPLLDQAALDAVKQWQFTPTLLNGVPVPVIMTVTVNFTLQ